MSDRNDLPPLPLPGGVSSRFIKCSATGLNFHLLQAGDRSKPLVILYHGYPELAFSFRKILPPLSSLGYYVIAPDQPGYGRTTGWDDRPYEEVDLTTYSNENMVKGYVALVHALGYKEVACIVGHDFGGVTAAMCALMRGDVFKACVIMSHPHSGPASLPFEAEEGDMKHYDDREDGIERSKDIDSDLASIGLKHYKTYNSTPLARNDWLHPKQGLHHFLRGYFHLKSAAYKPNYSAGRLQSWTANELKKMPGYYIMPKDLSMPQVVQKDMEGEDASATESWLPPEDVDTYVQEYSRTGYQGGLNWYRARTPQAPQNQKEMQLWANAKINVPTVFINGQQDWGNWQVPGALEGMNESCSDFRGVKLIEGAGHWVQQEKPDEVVKLISEFLSTLK